MAVTRVSISSILSSVKYDSMLANQLSLPSIPTIGTATNVGDGTSVTVSFTPGGIPGSSYTVLSTPGSITATGTSSPITVTGLTAGVSYTFQVKAVNATGESAYSASSNAVTPVAPFVATGGTITTPGDGYKYHTFTGGGTFAVTSGSQPAGTVMIVAGGGSGGRATNSAAGGGGAGGLVYVASTPFSPTGGNGSGSYTVSVGAGAAPYSVNPGATYQFGNQGTPSSFTGLTTAVGGGFGGNTQGVGPGGSGGGLSAGTPGGGGSGTPGQGNDGGSPNGQIDGNTGAGGGAGGRSPNGAGPQNGFSIGGPGATYFGSTYAGGGGGSTAQPFPSGTSFYPLVGQGGVGGGGEGAVLRTRPNPLGGPVLGRNTVSGTANTGGGGGGAVGLNTSGAGGSGIVIVRYPA